MTAILDYCVPSRRRGRQERKDQQALASRVNPRWGDIQITAPSEGGWNQPGAFSELENDLPVLPFINGSPQNSGSSASTTPDLSILYDKAVEAGIAIESRPEVVQLPPPKEERKNISFTITLPWPSRRNNSPPTAHSQLTNSPPSGSEPAKTNSRPSTAHSYQPVHYIPASDKYMRDLAALGKPSAHINPLAQSPPDRAVETFSAGTYAAQTDSQVATIASLGLSPSPPLHDGQSPVQAVVPDPVLRHGASPPLHHTSPIMRLEPIPATPYCVDNFSDDPRMERPEAVIPSHPAVVERSSRARSSSREPHSERYARMRSSSRGPGEDRSGSVRSSSRGAVEDRSSAMRSSSTGPPEDRIRAVSRGPTPDRVGAPRSSSRDPGPERFGTVRSSSRGPPIESVGTVRSSSRGPPLDSVGTVRSSSRGPPLDGVGTVRSSSRGPPSERVGTARSSSRGPPLERSGRARSSSMGPPAGRIATVRSASREPTAERLGYSRARRHDSFSSDSSSATMFSDDAEDNRAFQRAWASTKSIPNLNGLGQLPVTQNGTAQTGGPAGYYSSLASEYRQIAKDVENQALSETDSSEGKDYKKILKESLDGKDYKKILKESLDGKDYKKALKERLKETYQEPQTLVPHPTDLYG